MNKSTLITALVSAVSGGVAGGTITYLAVNKALRTRYEDWANEQIDSVKLRYAQINDDTKRSILDQATNPSPEIQEAVEAGKKIIERMGYSEDDLAEADQVHPSARTLSIFERGVDPDTIDDEADDEATDDGYIVIEGEPFLISEEAYFENENEYELDTLTYYEIDDTLTDQKNDRIDRVEETIGTRHLHMFKKNGTAKTSIYVQNDDHSSLYEIILIEESYAAKFLGMTEEELGLREPKQKVKKMRAGDGD